MAACWIIMLPLVRKLELLWMHVGGCERLAPTRSLVYEYAVGPRGRAPPCFSVAGAMTDCLHRVAPKLSFAMYQVCTSPVYWTRSPPRLES